jgi:ABC-type branched-subunit amino acid transport system substrate-binding protein
MPAAPCPLSGVKRTWRGLVKKIRAIGADAVLIDPQFAPIAVAMCWPDAALSIFQTIIALPL